MISCGEPSGDLYAGALVHALRARDPQLEAFGLGGEQLASAGARLVADFRGLSVTGLTEALKVLPRSWATYKQLVTAAREQRPDVLVLIDYPDFNFRLMRAIKALGIPIVYYISPQLWAWRPGRMKTMKELVDRVLVDLPVRRGAVSDRRRRGALRRPPAARAGNANGRQGHARPRVRTSAGPPDRGAAAGEPAERADPPGAGPRRGRRRHRRARPWRPVHRRPSATSRFIALRARSLRRPSSKDAPMTC